MSEPEKRLPPQHTTQLLVDNEAIMDLPQARIHTEQPHRLIHPNGISLIAEQGTLDSTNETHVATEPAPFTRGVGYPHLDINGNTRLVFKIAIPVRELDKGNMVILSRRNGKPTHRQVSGFAQVVEEMPSVVLGQQDFPVDDAEGVVEALIHETSTSLQTLQGERVQSNTQFDYFVGNDHAEHGAKAIDTWEVLICRDDGDGEVRQLKPEHLFRFGVHF